MMFQQLEIRWVDLDPARGAETRKNRPCVVVSSSMVNRHSRTIIVAPLLPNHKPWPFVVNVDPTDGNGLDKPRHVNLKQMRAVDSSRIRNRQGVLDRSHRPAIDAALGLIFDR